MNKITKAFGIAGICAAAYSCQPRSAQEPITAENFQKGDSIINTDFGTDARILNVRKLDDIKYDTVILNNKTSELQYKLIGSFNVDLTSGNDDATGLPIVRFYSHLPGAVTVTKVPGTIALTKTDYNTKK
jgi:hypothetical protein